jgi:hypothetical protein
MIYWSWLLGVIGVTGLLIAGQKKWWGWVLNVFNEGLWIFYALLTEQYGFILMALAYAIVYARNARAWKHDGQQTV